MISVASSVLEEASFISISISMLMTEGGRTEQGLGDIEYDAAELVGEREGSTMSLLPARKLLMLPSKLLQETRREALLVGGDGIGPTSSAINICAAGCGCCCNWLCDPRRDKDRLAVSVASSPTNGRSRSISCGFDPDTGKLRFFNSAFKSLTFISSRRTVIRVVLLGVADMTEAMDSLCVLGAGEGAAVVEQVDDGREADKRAAVKLLAASSVVAAAL